MSQRVKKTPCLYCGRKLDMATALEDGSTVHPGAITVCLYCGHVMAYTEKMTMRALTDEEMKDIAGNKFLLAAQKIRAVYMMGKQK